MGILQFMRWIQQKIWATKSKAFCMIQYMWCYVVLCHCYVWTCVKPCSKARQAKAISKGYVELTREFIPKKPRKLAFSLHKKHVYFLHFVQYILILPGSSHKNPYSGHCKDNIHEFKELIIWKQSISLLQIEPDY